MMALTSRSAPSLLNMATQQPTRPATMRYMHFDFTLKAQPRPVQLTSVTFQRGMLRGTISVRSTQATESSKVYVRYTADNWVTFGEVPANMVCLNPEETESYFFFMCQVPDSLQDGDIVQFAVRCELPWGDNMWDNNDGKNYHAHMRTVSTAVTPESSPKGRTALPRQLSVRAQ
eukprot:comp6670_c0_seq1/m.2448 comp6670_c0_seq1/g.2448  ORF comp6670_c0_seq1/g.2448 comp6670_c0_seq1/m.2448 type:complete len:174 (-) comp6670_c0_seq1:455-976(-)